jgi:hypothetical protein
MIPKTTEPLAKFIRTGEGILVFGFNIALLVVPIISSSLTAAQAAKWAAVIDGIAVVSRTGLKIVSTLQAANPNALTQPALAAPPTAPAVSATVSPSALSPGSTAQIAGGTGLAIADIQRVGSGVEQRTNGPAPAHAQPSDAVPPLGAAERPIGLVGSSSQPAAAPFLIRLEG